MRLPLRSPLLLALLTPATLVAQEPPTIGLQAELRARQAWLAPTSGGSGGSPGIVRSRLGAAVAPGDWGRGLVELQYARGFGEPIVSGDTLPGSLGVYQAWLELGGDLRGWDARVRVGRQEIVFGNERLLGADDWSAIGLSFDGARILVNGPGEIWSAGVFGARPADVPRREEILIRGSGRRATLWGAHGELSVGRAIVLREEGGSLPDGRDVDRTTVGLHFHTPASTRVRAELEWAYQWGGIRESPWGARIEPAEPERDLRASLVGARLGLRDALDRLRYLGAGLDQLSGESWEDRAYGAFHAPYGSPHEFYGLRDHFLAPPGIAMARGLVDAFVEAGWDVTGAGELEVALHRFWSAKDPSHTTDRRLGWELDLRMPVRLGRVAELDLGYSIYDFATEMPRHWAYAQLTLGG